MFVHSAVDDAGLSLKAFRVLGHLHRRAGKSEYAWPGVKTIADAIGLNRKTVNEALAELVTAGFVSREPRPGTSTGYRLARFPSIAAKAQEDADSTPVHAGAENGLIQKTVQPGKRAGNRPENGLAPKTTQAGAGAEGGPENGPGPARKTGHKDNPIKETKEEDPVFISFNACGGMASTAAEAPAALSPPPPPPPGPPAPDSGPPFPAGKMVNFRKPPNPAPEEFAIAGSLVPVPEPLLSASFTAAWESFCRHRQHLWRLNRTPWTRDAAGSLLEKCLRHGPPASVEAIRRTVESGKWTGLYFDAGGAGRAQAKGRTPYRARPFPVPAAPREHGEAPPPEDFFAESRRNRDRLRWEQEGEPPSGWNGNDGAEPQPPIPQIQHWEGRAA